MKRKLLSLLVLLMTAVTGAWAETIDLSTLTANKIAQDGDVLTGTLDGTNQKYKISIANGATVTLDGVTINGVTDGAAEASYSTVNWAGLTCEGNATIILKEGTTNTVRGFYHRCPGIFIPQGYTLTIEGPGTLNASGSISTEGNHVDKSGNLITCAPGIGSAVLATAGNIVINGGTINATGGWASASIGGNFLTGCGNITITGGTVNATGSLAAAGIGGGWVASCGDIVITGGTINATGGDYINSDATGNDGGPAIGGSPCGSCGNITIGGTANVTVTKGLGAPYSIGQGGSWNNVSATCGTVTVFGVEGQISDSPYNATASYNVTFKAGTEDATSWQGKAGEGEYQALPLEGVAAGTAVSVKYNGTKKVKSVTVVKKAASVVTDLSTKNTAYTAQNGETLTGTLASNVKISIADGATVILHNVSINADGTWDDEEDDHAGITCIGDATIILSGTNNVKGFFEDYPGIYVPGSNTVTIKGSGSLTASSNGYGAGIGGGFGISCGNIEIQGGVITATGGWSGAGIGAGCGIGTGESICGTITISGGTVTAIGGDYAAGIGSGYAQNADNPSTCGAISISGGTVSATAGALAPAAIGKGAVDAGESTCASVTFTPGITSLTLTNTNSGVTGIVSNFINATAVNANTTPITTMLSTSVTDPAITGGMTSAGFATSYNGGTKTWTITK